MNPLPTNKAAEEKFVEYCQSYYRRLLRRADIVARTRNGNTIETGDFERALEHVESRGRRSQILLSFGGAGVGAGLSGLVQNALDNKSIIYLLAFAAVFVLGGALFLLARDE